MSTNFNYETRFTAINTMTPAINEATQSIEQLRIKLDQTNMSARNTAEGFRGLNTSISTGGFSQIGAIADQNAYAMNRQLMALRGMIFGVQMSMFYVSMLTSNQMAMESATNNVEGAQERLNAIMQEGGRGTLEYRNAVRQLENAQINLNRAQTMTTIMTASIALQAVSMGVSFMQALPSIRSMISALQSYNAVAAISKALSGPAGWAMLGVGLAVGAGATYAISQMSNGSGQVNINAPVTVNGDQDLDTALDIQNRKIKNEYRRVTGK